MAKAVKDPKVKTLFFDNRLTRVERDWTLGFVFGLVIMITGIGFSAYFYNKYRNAETSEQVGYLEISYNEKLVESALEGLGLRSERYQKIIKNNVDFSKNNQGLTLEKTEVTERGDVDDNWFGETPEIENKDEGFEDKVEEKTIEEEIDLREDFENVPEMGL